MEHIHTDQWLAHRFRPILVFSRQSSVPCTIEYLCQQFRLVDGKGQELSAPGTYTPDQIVSNPIWNRSDVQLIPLKDWEDQRSYDDIKTDSVYCAVTKIDENHAMLQYFFLYPDNKGYHCAGFHWGDVERLTLVVDRLHIRILRAFYAAHSNVQGQWVDPKNIEYSNYRPIVYVAGGSNASYPKQGCYPRICCLFNDVVRSTNLSDVWEPTTVQLISEDATPWITWKGKIGTASLPGRHNYWRKEPFNGKITWWQRLFCCCTW